MKERRAADLAIKEARLAERLRAQRKRAEEKVYYDSLSRAVKLIYNRRKRQGLPLRDPGESVAVEPVLHMPAPSSPHALRST